VSYVLEWSEAALNTAAGFLDDDPAGLGQLIAALDELTHDSFAGASSALGDRGLRRLRVGGYRALSEIVERMTISSSTEAASGKPSHPIDSRSCRCADDAVGRARGEDGG
jgi:mRNA interferase RelE/StbE